MTSIGAGRPDLDLWVPRFLAFLEQGGTADAAHDLQHIRRVVRQAERLAALEGARLEVVVPAAWLHDCVSVPKHSIDRPRASAMAAEVAAGFLADGGYPPELIPAIRHAIHAHSFSAGIPPETLEAKVVQDADRLDALGAIGIARTLMLGATMGLPLYDSEEPIPLHREPDDRANTLDHFFVKLFTLAGTMQTESGRAEAELRTRLLRDFVNELAREVGQEAEL